MSNSGSNEIDRSRQFFGASGQEHLQATTVGIVGIGGVGTHVVQQLALLRIGGLVLVVTGRQTIPTGDELAFLEAPFGGGVLRVLHFPE